MLSEGPDPARPLAVAPPGWIAAAALAVLLPTLLAYNPPPSATFLNQVAAFVGWGALVLLVADAPGVVLGRPWRMPGGILLAALALLALAAAAGPFWSGLPWPLALSAVGALAATALVAATGTALARAGRAVAAFHALSVALLAAGVIGALIGFVQVFVPQWTDGQLLAAISNGRAAGNLRQPNHLSSLLLWSLIALVWLSERRHLARGWALALGVLVLAGIVLTGSRTGALGLLVLASWGALDRRLSRGLRLALAAAPVAYALLWIALGAWAHLTQHDFGGDTQFTKGDLSSSRFAIWSNTLALIARHPWLGVGWGEFNFAWSLTPFPDRPIAFFDHTHNLPLQFAVELGVPLALLVLVLLAWALLSAWRAGARCEDAATRLTLRAAFVMVAMMAVHSQFEYPLWYAYFLLPTAFAFGLCLGGEGAGRADGQDTAAPAAAWPLRAAAVLLMVSGLAAIVDYRRVVVIYAPGASAPPLAERIADGKRSWLFGHHADYAEVTTGENVTDPDRAFARVSHYLLDTRLMMAWAKALAASGQVDAARHVAARLREFRNPQAQPFFEVCDMLEDEVDAAAPFQCQPASAPLGFEAFRH